MSPLSLPTSLFLCFLPCFIPSPRPKGPQKSKPRPRSEQYLFGTFMFLFVQAVDNINGVLSIWIYRDSWCFSNIISDTNRRGMEVFDWVVFAHTHTHTHTHTREWVGGRGGGRKRERPKQDKQSLNIDSLAALILIRLAQAPHITKKQWFIQPSVYEPAPLFLFQQTARKWYRIVPRLEHPLLCCSVTKVIWPWKPFETFHYHVHIILVVWRCSSEFSAKMFFGVFFLFFFLSNTLQKLRSDLPGTQTIPALTLFW